MIEPDSPPDGRLARYWSLDPGVTYLNHGSFGACPVAVLSHQHRLREELEREPVDFLVRRLPDALDAARAALAAFLGADPDGLVPVSNATAGVNAVLRSLELPAGSELLVTDHAYNACRNALEFVAARWGARVVVVALPLPLEGPGAVVEAVLAAVSARTRLALLDHVTSPTALVLPLEEIVPALESRGVEVLVDGAHAPGMLALDLDALDATYYTGNCHKWLCAPKGAAFLLVSERARNAIHPTVISHGMNRRRPGRSRLHDEFDWTGTEDPTAFLCVPHAIEHVGSLLAGGWPAVRARNRALACEARRMLNDLLDAAPLCPEPMLGSIASIRLPRGVGPETFDGVAMDPLQAALRDRHRIEVPVMPSPTEPGERLLRVSAQLYNGRGDYEHLCEALGALLG